MIDETTYADYRARIDAKMAWVDTIRDKRSGWASYRPEDMPDEVRALGVTNEMRALVGEYELHRDKPAKFSAYVYERPNASIGKDWHVGLWAPAEMLGRAFVTSSWRDRHGNRRYSIRVRADWGGEYVGQTQGAGMYVNLRRVKV